MSIHMFSLTRHRGFSLMELMIALSIGFIGVAVAGYLYLGNRQTFRMQSSMSAIQENSRFALDTMSQDIRMAGYMGCGSQTSVVVNNITKNPQLATPVVGLEVFPDGAGWVAPAGVTRVAGDVLRISRAGATGVTLTGNMSVPTANIQIGGNPTGFVAGNVLMVSDCQNADVFVATNVSNGIGTVTIAHASNVNTANFLSKTYGVTSPPAQVYMFQQTDYFVGCPTSAWNGSVCSEPDALYQVQNNGTPIALVDNVENMAFSLGVGTQGVVSAYQTPAVVAAANNWANVLTVQTHLLMVGGPAFDPGSNVAVTPQPYTFPANATFPPANQGTVYPADRRLREETIATIAIRNRLP